MPLYVYRCPKCGREAEEQRSIEERDVGPKCPTCRHRMPRVPSVPTAPTGFPGSDDWRR
jgi:putative FmdB family regulatory protein